MKSAAAALLVFIAAVAWTASAGDPLTDRWDLNYPKDNNYSPFWRLLCKTRPVYTGRVDPIIVQGSWAGHVHKVFGSAGFSESRAGQTPLEFYDDITKASCTGCNIAKLDMSVYWHPELYYRNPAGQYEIVKGEGLTVYYLSRRGGKPDWWIPFPKGFRMIAGDQQRRSFNKDDVRDRAITYACYGGEGFSGTTYEDNGFPGYQNKSIGCSAIRLQIFFPTCWNGKDLDVPDHRSHMAYPIGDISQGDCPATHPYRLPGVFFEAFYNTNLYPHGDGKITWPFVLSQGDLTGYGMHGDFVTGWDEEALHRALHDQSCNCGNVDCCNTFKAYQQGAGADCPMDKPMPFYEDVGMTTPITKLPGCNNMTGLGPSAGSCKSPSPALTDASTGTHRAFIASTTKGILTPPWAEPWELVTATRTVMNLDNVFSIVNVKDGGIVAFQNVLSKGYLVHWVDAKVYSMQNSLPEVKKNDWYHWKIVNQANGLTAVMSVKDGSYLTLGPNGVVTCPKVSQVGAAQLWLLTDQTRWTGNNTPVPVPTFSAAPTVSSQPTPVPTGSGTEVKAGHYRFKLASSSSYIKSDKGGVLTVESQGTNFRVQISNDGATLFSDISMKFTTADNAGNDRLIANRGAASGWEMFTFTAVGNNWTITAKANGKLVAKQGDGSVKATATVADANSLWYLESI